MRAGNATATKRISWTRLAAKVAVATALACATYATPRNARAQESQLAALRDAAHASPADPSASLAYGRALRRAGHAADAVAELRRGASLFASRGGSEPALRLHWELARAYVARRDLGNALVQCRVLGAKPGGAAAGHACGAETQLLPRRATEVHAELAELAKIQSAPAWVAYRARVAEGLSDRLELRDADAETAFRAAIAMDTSQGEAHVALGKLLAETGRDGSAELSQAIAIDPHDAEALFTLGRVTAAATGTADPTAISLYERAIADRPTFVDALRALAEAELFRGRNTEAKHAAQAALAVDPRDVASLLVAGKVALAENDPDTALQDGNAALAVLSNSAPAKLLVADSYAKKGEIDLALESYQAAHGLDPGSSVALLHASSACVAANRPTTAKAFAERATRDFPDDGPSWVMLGDALVAYGDPPAAKSAYETARSKRGVDVALIDAKLARLR